MLIKTITYNYFSNQTLPASPHKLLQRGEGDEINNMQGISPRLKLLREN